MRKLAAFALLAVAFLVFSAQNCQKRDPLEEPGTRNNPKVVGLPWGEIIASVKTGPANPALEGATVYLALSLDSLQNKQYVRFLRTAVDSTGSNAAADFQNLQLRK